MRRKEIAAKTITQSNDASCHSPRANGHKARASLKRTSSKKLRQAVAKDTAEQVADADPLKPGLGLLVKLGSIAVHVDEMLSPGGHEADRIAINQLLNDEDVKAWVIALTRSGMLPVKR